MNENFEVTKQDTKRDIFRFEGDKPTAVNLEYINMIQLEQNRITFTFQYNNFALDLSDADMAKKIYDKIVEIWASDIRP